MIIPKDILVAALKRRTEQEPRWDGELVITPFDYMDKTPVELLVRKLGDDHYLITDLGGTADQIANAGAYIEGRLEESWDALCATLPMDVSGVDGGQIAATSTLADLGDTMVEVATRALQAEQLKVLAPGYRPKTFADVVMRRASESRLVVKPLATLTNRLGGTREVAFSATAGDRTVYVMTLSGDGNESPDRAYSVFATADAPTDDRISVVARNMRIKTWQLAQLGEVSQVVTEDEQGAFWDTLAA